MGPEPVEGMRPELPKECALSLSKGSARRDWMGPEPVEGMRPEPVEGL
jgi:hypothetical protein